MARVCILAPSSVRYMPYLRYYEDALAAAGAQCDVLLWDRYGTGEERPNARAYERPGTARGLALVPAYLGFRRFLLRHLNAQAHDLYVVLGLQIGVLLYDFLRSRPFVLDIRDHSHERLPPYRAAAHDLVRRARMVAISSRGFLEWLPRGVEYVMSHNVSRAHLDRTAAPFDRGRKILSYVGAVGYYRPNTRFIEGAALRSDWEVRYVGRGTCEAELEAYCRARGVTNVTFHGAFQPHEKPALLDAANFVLGIYGDDSPVVRTATPNRLYEACVHRRPIVVNEGTHLAALVKSSRLGIALDLRDTSRWSAAIDLFYERGCYEEYVANAEQFLREVRRDLDAFESTLASVLGSEAIRRKSETP